MQWRELAALRRREFADLWNADLRPAKFARSRCSIRTTISARTTSSGCAKVWATAAAGWHLSPLYPLYGLARDLLLPALFAGALHGDDFVWRGNEMQVERMRPRRMMALMRPRLSDIAPMTRRRLRLLRARMS